MNIIEIARQIELKEKFGKSKKADIDWKPEECIDYTLPKFTIPESNAKGYSAKIKKKLSKVLAFIDYVKVMRLSHGCTIMPISCTNKTLISICGNHQNVSNLISFMKIIGLLQDYNNKYQFNANNKEFNKSKLYKYFYNNEINIIQYCEKNSINKFIIKNYYSECHRDTVVQKCKIGSFEREKVRFSSKVHFLKPDNYSHDDFKKYLNAALYENYPTLSYYQKLADEINEKYYAEDPELAIRFTPNFT